MSLENKLRLEHSKLRFKFTNDLVPWSTTRKVPVCRDIIGQQRALRAIKLGLEIKNVGFNIFVTGLSGTGKMTTIKSMLEDIHATAKTPSDLCYVNNFKNPDMPRILKFPAGKGKEFKKEMAVLIGELKKRIPEVLDSDNFKKKWDDLLETLRAQEKELIHQFEYEVNKKNFALTQVQVGTVQKPELMPVIAGNATNMSQLEELADSGQFDKEEFEKIRTIYKELILKMGELSKKLKELQRKLQRDQETLMKEAVRPYLEESISDIKARFPWDGVTSYLDEVMEDILDHLERFQEKEEPQQSNIFSVLMGGQATSLANPFLPYSVNVIVDNSDLTGVPIIIETTPNYRNLFGTIEKRMDRSGVAQTDFTKIKGGSLLRANGGYLVINARDAFIEPEVWKNLKRALKYNKVTIQSFDPMFMLSSVFLSPEPIDIDVKVVMIGDKEIYHLLYQWDEDFRKIFKVLADFDSVMPNTKDNIACFVSLMSKICEEEKLLHFNREGIKAVLEQAIRKAGRKNRLTTRFSDVADLMRESSYWAQQDSSKEVSRKHVKKAVNEIIFRNNLLEEKIQELIDEGIILIDSEGKQVGQVNGLSVYMLGYYAFGKPTRITAEVAVGKEGVVNIERESGMSGRTHDKGVLIISNLLRARYTGDKPLSMHASICFEQSYSGVDGDSASSAEVYALMSALSGLPLRQDIAVTGSVNQKGQIQPIGGVNEKIEGFFDTCAARGLTGTQGVIIPAQNVEDLMLRKEVVDAVKKKQFHIYAVSTIDEGIEILTGVKSGILNSKGHWSPDSVNDLVNKRLQEFANTLKRYGRQ